MMPGWLAPGSPCGLPAGSWWSLCLHRAAAVAARPGSRRFIVVPDGYGQVRETACGKLRRAAGGGAARLGGVAGDGKAPG